MKKLLVVIALTACNNAGLPRAGLWQDGVFQVTTTIERDNTSPPVVQPPVSETEGDTHDGKMSFLFPELSRIIFSGFGRRDLVGDAYAGAITMCGAQRDELIERIDDGVGFSDTVTFRRTQTWTGVDNADPSCETRAALPDHDGETVAQIRFDIIERCQADCGALVIGDVSQGGFHCGPCPPPKQ
jgi:hypothetical protein